MNLKNDVIEVSVIIPNFNYGKYIEECITSVLNSDLHSNKIEIIVIDDGSTDNSVSIVKRIINESTANILLIEKESNSGQAKTRNIGIAQASGNYLFFLDSDNYIKKNCLKKHLEVLFSNQDYSVAYAPIQRFDDVTGENLAVFSNEIYNPEKLAQENYIDNMAMVRRADFIEVGMFDENLMGWEDYELWLRLRNNNKKMFFIEGEPLSFYRVHENSWSNTISLSNQQGLKAYIDAKHGLNISPGIDNYNIPSNYAITSLDRARIKIFWAEQESQFEEQRSQTKYMKLYSSVNTATFYIDSKKNTIANLRIEIGDRIGFLNIHDIVIRDKEGNALWDWNKNEMKTREDVLLIESFDFFQEKTLQLSTSNSPGFEIAIMNLHSERLITELNIQISLSYVDTNQHELLNKIINKTLTYISPKDIYALQTTINAVNEEKENLLIQIKEDNLMLSNIKNENSLYLTHLDTKNSFIEQLVSEKKYLVNEHDLKNNTISKINQEKEHQEDTIQEMNKLLKELVAQKKKLISIIQKQQEQLDGLVVKNKKAPVTVIKKKM
jgi:glycosyltransferase involved in cell wall biosynthesis